MRKPRVGFLTFAIKSAHRENPAPSNLKVPPKAGVARSLHCPEKHEQKRYFAAPKKEEQHPLSSIVSAANVAGNLTCLACLFGRKWRRSPLCPRLQPLLGELHRARFWLNRSPLSENSDAGSLPEATHPPLPVGFSPSGIRSLHRDSL